MSKRLHCSSDNSSGLFFSLSQKEKEKKKRKKQLMLRSLIYCPVPDILPVVLKAQTVFAGAGQ